MKKEKCILLEPLLLHITQFLRAGTHNTIRRGDISGLISVSSSISLPFHFSFHSCILSRALSQLIVNNVWTTPLPQKTVGELTCHPPPTSRAAPDGDIQASSDLAAHSSGHRFSHGSRLSLRGVCWWICLRGVRLLRPFWMFFVGRRI